MRFQSGGAKGQAGTDNPVHFDTLDWGGILYVVETDGRQHGLPARLRGAPPVMHGHVLPSQGRAPPSRRPTVLGVPRYVIPPPVLLAGSTYWLPRMARRVWQRRVRGHLCHNSTCIYKSATRAPYSDGASIGLVLPHVASVSFVFALHHR